MGSIQQEIQELKESRHAVILAHNYTLGEVQDIADFTGDSLELSRKAAECHAPVIVFCGVRFMAETAKILSPESIVLHPSPDAGCPMAEQLDLPALRALRRMPRPSSWTEMSAGLRKTSENTARSGKKPKGRNTMITSKQRAYLRSMANTMDPILFIGKEGVTEATAKEAYDALEARELIKGTVQQNCDLSAKEALEALCEMVHAEPVQCIGRRFVLYRRSRQPKIELP